MSMIIRVVAYHALPGKDVIAWMKRIAPVLRGEEGLRQVEFMRSTSDPSRWGAVEHYGSLHVRIFSILSLQNSSVT